MQAPFSPLTSCQRQYFSFKNSELRAIYEAPFVGSGFKRMMSEEMHEARASQPKPVSLSQSARAGGLGPGFDISALNPSL